MHTQLDQIRIETSASLNQKRRAKLGQFMTPSTVAQFMASLFPNTKQDSIRLLDAGAGIGSLTAAFLDRWAIGDFQFKNVDATLYEIDKTLRKHLKQTLTTYEARLKVKSTVISNDFIEDAVNVLQNHLEPLYTHAILNPPYKKISSKSRHRLMPRQVGIETVNLYSTFVALTVALMEPCGYVVAILPRSFCNGPYYKPFREFILERAAIRHIHLFDARNKAFKDDKVLQEHVIILLERSGKQGDVTISTSTDDSFTDHSTHIYPFKRIVLPSDSERFIHIPTSPKLNIIELSTGIRYSLADLGIEVSTGPVVDFRLREHLRHKPESGTVPLLYPSHFSDQTIEWPKSNTKKPNAIQRNLVTEKWLYPAGFYVLVRRFSSKEEKRRIMACIVDPATFPDISSLGFENHLNVFHFHKKGLSETLVRGLAVYLNSTIIDDYFRRFSGHTQVNATDLRLMKYPSYEILTTLGKWAKVHNKLTQAMIDEQIGKFI